MRKWRQYLLGHPFVILTDHKSLKELMSQVIQTHEQQVYLSKLLGYDYSIQYKVGKSNIVTDALSRISEHIEGQFFVLSMPNFTLLEDLCKSLIDSPDFHKLVTQIQHNPACFTNYKIQNGINFFKGKIWLDPTNHFKLLLMEEYHKNPLEDHMGVAKSLHRL